MEAWLCKTCGSLMTRAEAFEGRCRRRPRLRDCPLRPPAANDDMPIGPVAVGTIDDSRQGELRW